MTTHRPGGADPARQSVADRKPAQRRRALIAALALLLGLGAGWIWWRATRTDGAGSAGSFAAGATSASAQPQLADPTALVGLHEPGTDPRADVRIVGAVLRNYLQAVTGPDAPPLGFNEEVVRALRGANPLGVAFLPANHPAIDAQGRLCDRWGTPYFFHPLAAADYEIRSAGPDRNLFTADDLVGRSVGE